MAKFKTLMFTALLFMTSTRYADVASSTEPAAIYFCIHERTSEIYLQQNGQQKVWEPDADNGPFSLRYYEGVVAPDKQSIQLPRIEKGVNGEVPPAPIVNQKCNNGFFDLFTKDIVQSDIAESRARIIDLCSSAINEPRSFSTYGEVFDGWHFVPPIEGKPRQTRYRHSNMRDDDRVFLEVGSCLKVD